MQKITLIVLILFITVSGCAYKKTIKLGPSSEDEEPIKKSELDILIDYSISLHKDKNEYKPKEEGFFFKALPEDYNPNLSPDSIENRNKSEQF